MPDLLTMPAKEAIREVERIRRRGMVTEPTCDRCHQPRAGAAHTKADPDYHLYEPGGPRVVDSETIAAWDALLALAREALLARAEKEKTR
ncbi:MAG TPA: hypothetical protein PK948_05020 [Gemmatimonadales bacterium]|nr:hypothetical protein [Gemmatimonadales bacterium]